MVLTGIIQLGEKKPPPLIVTFLRVTAAFLLVLIHRVASRCLLSRGNQWEAVTLCGQRHYSDDSLPPIKHTKKIQAPLS